MQLIGPRKRPGPPVLAIQQLPPAGNDRFLDSPLPQPLLKFRIGAHRFGPPLIPRQIAYAEGSDRFVDTPLTHPLLKFRIGLRPFGPPLSPRQIAFAEGSDRYLDSPLPGPQRLMGLGGRYRAGPPILVRQAGYAEGNDRFIDSITHPLVRFRIGSRGSMGPPLARGDQALFPTTFPIQYAGLRAFYGGSVKELCLVAEADAPPGMGGVVKILKGVIKYCVYLVETTDPNASSIRIKTSTGIKSIRLKT